MSRSAGEPGTLDVNGEDLVKLILSLLLHGALRSGYTRVVHQDVHSAELVHRFLDHRIDLVPAGQIDRNCQHPPASGVQFDGCG